MKHFIRYILATAMLLLCSIGAMADGAATISKLIDGNDAGTKNPGEVTYSDGTITVTPAEGYYLTAEDLKVSKLIDGGEAQTRTTGYNVPVTITATNETADPSGTTIYTFTITDAKHDYEIVANFHTKMSLEKATIAVPETPVYYSGEAQKPEATVTIGETTLKLGTDYTIAYTDSIDAGTGHITITGIRKYTGTATHDYTISKAIVTFQFQDADKAEVTAIDDVDYGATDFEPTLAIEPASFTDVIFSFSSDDGEVIDIDSATGKITTKGIGRVTVTVTPKEESYANYEVADVSASYSFKVLPTISFSEKAYTAKYGEDFTSPTAIVAPVGTAIAYSSSATDVATVDEASGAVTFLKAGEATIKATIPANTTIGYEAIVTSYTLTISKGNAALTYTAETAYAEAGKDFTAPTLTNPNKVTVAYSSTNETIATIDNTGKVSALAEGETTIWAKFAGNDAFEKDSASYVLIVNKAQGEGYPLWIGDTQVTSDNKSDVLKNGTSSKAGSFIFDSDENTLIITNDTTKLVIESRLSELTIFLNDLSKLERIFFNNMGNTANTGKLTFTSYKNIPGKVSLSTTHVNGVISGFSSVSFDEGTNTFLIEPEDGVYEGGKLLKAEGGAVADVATVGQYIKPLVEDKSVEFKDNDFVTTDASGNTVDRDLSNTTINDVLFVLIQSNANDDDNDGYDTEEHGVALVSTLTDEKVDEIAKNVENGKYLPGGSDFANDYKGGTVFMVPDGKGYIEVEAKSNPGYEFHLKIGTAKPEVINNPVKAVTRIAYDVKKTEYIYLYQVATGSAGTRIGKRDKAHGTIFSVHVSALDVESPNPLASSKSAFPTSLAPAVTTGTEPEPTPTPDPPSAIKDVNVDESSDKWFGLDGQQIDKPTKKGLYIRNGKKVIIR